MSPVFYPPHSFFLASSSSGRTRQAPPLLGPQPPDDVIWVDLPAADRLSLSAAQERYGLPAEVMTYFLLRYQSAKVIHAGPALFLVTFLATPSSRHLFSTRELKICVTQTLIVTLCGPDGRARSKLARTVPLLPGLNTGGAGRFLHGLLQGVVESYEAVVKMVTERRLDRASREERQGWRKRVERLIHVLRDQQVFLSNVGREGGKLFAGEEGLQFKRLEERTEALVRVAGEAVCKGEIPATRFGSALAPRKGRRA